MTFLKGMLDANRAAVWDPAYLSGLPDAPPRTAPSLRSAIEAHAENGALLVEYKRVSPGQHERRLPPRTISQFARITDSTDVAGLSCVAAGPEFDGSPWDVLDLARATSRPILFKDFITEDRQLDAARQTGASAILLIARLGRASPFRVPLADLADGAHRRGLEVLLEFHAEAELSVANGVAADMFGVNVRDLDSLQLDRPTAERTLARARDGGLRPLLGLSGVEGPAEARRFWEAGVDGLLVGTAVARTGRPVDFLASLQRERP
jgi:indole-3-glycerol phosphate synthase